MPRSSNQAVPTHISREDGDSLSIPDTDVRRGLRCINVECGAPQNIVPPVRSLQPLMLLIA